MFLLALWSIVRAMIAAGGGSFDQSGRSAQSLVMLGYINHVFAVARMRLIRSATLLGLLLVAAGPAAAQVIAPAAPATRGREQRTGLGEIRSWGYQLQRANPERVAASPFDLVVVDYSRNGTESGRFSRAEVERMRKRPDGGRR